MSHWPLDHGQGESECPLQSAPGLLALFGAGATLHAAMDDVSSSIHESGCQRKRVKHR